MNKNIEVINENLWAVNFDLVTQGFIKDLTFNVADGSDYATYTQDGKLVLNKSKPIYKDVLKYLNWIMKMSDKQLSTNKGLYSIIKELEPTTKNFNDEEMEAFIEHNQLMAVKKFIINLCDIEKERRRIQALYIKGNQQPFGIDTIKRIFKKGGSNYGKH